LSSKCPTAAELPSIVQFGVVGQANSNGIVSAGDPRRHNSSERLPLFWVAVCILLGHDGTPRKGEAAGPRDRRSGWWGSDFRRSRRPPGASFSMSSTNCGQDVAELAGVGGGTIAIMRSIISRGVEDGLAERRGRRVEGGRAAWSRLGEVLRRRRANGNAASAHRLVIAGQVRTPGLIVLDLDAKTAPLPGAIASAIDSNACLVET